MNTWHLTEAAPIPYGKPVIAAYGGCYIKVNAYPVVSVLKRHMDTGVEYTVWHDCYSGFPRCKPTYWYQFDPAHGFLRISLQSIASSFRLIVFTS